LDEIKKKYGNQKICLILYGASPKSIEKANEYISHKGFNVIHFQDGYREFEWETVMTTLQEYHDTINILLIGMATPTIPMQELWTLRNYDQIKKN
jgi:UDP-N-acetyl-D-mannosaminuronic acid transferase (WecB/TagA/CpsF family)